MDEQERDWMMDEMDFLQQVEFDEEDEDDSDEPEDNAEVEEMEASRENQAEEESDSDDVDDESNGEDNDQEEESRGKETAAPGCSKQAHTGENSTLPESLRKAFGLLEGPMRRNSREQAKPEGKDGGHSSQPSTSSSPGAAARSTTLELMSDEECDDKQRNQGGINANRKSVHPGSSSRDAPTDEPMEQDVRQVDNVVMMAEEGADNASEEDDALDEEDYVSDDYNDEDDVDDPATDNTPAAAPVLYDALQQAIRRREEAALNHILIETDEEDIEVLSEDINVQIVKENIQKDKGKKRVGLNLQATIIPSSPLRRADSDDSDEIIFRPVNSRNVSPEPVAGPSTAAQPQSRHSASKEAIIRILDEATSSVEPVTLPMPQQNSPSSPQGYPASPPSPETSDQPLSSLVDVSSVLRPNIKIRCLNELVDTKDPNQAAMNEAKTQNTNTQRSNVLASIREKKEREEEFNRRRYNAQLNRQNDKDSSSDEEAKSLTPRIYRHVPMQRLTVGTRYISSGERQQQESEDLRIVVKDEPWSDLPAPVPTQNTSSPRVGDVPIQSAFSDSISKEKEAAELLEVERIAAELAAGDEELHAVAKRPRLDGAAARSGAQEPEPRGEPAAPEPVPGCSHWGSSNTAPDRASPQQGVTSSGTPPVNFEEKYNLLLSQHMILLTKLQTAVECPVCMEVPRRAPVTCCSNGHVVCSSCLDRGTIRECPTCKVKMDGPRCVSNVANSILDLIPHPCTYKDVGCDYESQNAEDLKKHEQSCNHREVRCPSFSCPNKSSLQRMAAHLSGGGHESMEEVHSVPNTFTRVLGRSRRLTDFQPLRFMFDNRIFYLQSIASDDAKLLYNFVQMEGDRAQCCGYKANISLISDEQGCEPMKHSVQITPLDLHCKDNFGQIGFMMICTNMVLEEYISDSGPGDLPCFKLHIKMVKLDKANSEKLLLKSEKHAATTAQTEKENKKAKVVDAVTRHLIISAQYNHPGSSLTSDFRRKVLMYACNQQGANLQKILDCEKSVLRKRAISGPLDVNSRTFYLTTLERYLRARNNGGMQLALQTTFGTPADNDNNRSRRPTPAAVMLQDRLGIRRPDDPWTLSSTSQERMRTARSFLGVQGLVRSAGSRHRRENIAEPDFPDFSLRSIRPDVNNQNNEDEDPMDEIYRVQNPF